MKLICSYLTHLSCRKKVRIWIFFDPYFSFFGLNMKIHHVNLNFQSQCKKIRIRKNSKFGHFSRIANNIVLVSLSHPTQNNAWIYCFFSCYWHLLTGKSNGTHPDAFFWKYRLCKISQIHRKTPETLSYRHPGIGVSL